MKRQHILLNFIEGSLNAIPDTCLDRFKETHSYYVSHWMEWEAQFLGSKSLLVLLLLKYCSFLFVDFRALASSFSISSLLDRDHTWMQLRWCIRKVTRLFRPRFRSKKTLTLQIMNKLFTTHYRRITAEMSRRQLRRRPQIFAIPERLLLFNWCYKTHESIIILEGRDLFRKFLHTPSLFISSSSRVGSSWRCCWRMNEGWKRWGKTMTTVKLFWCNNKKKLVSRTMSPIFRKKCITVDLALLATQVYLLFGSFLLWLCLDFCQMFYDVSYFSCWLLLMLFSGLLTWHLLHLGSCFSSSWDAILCACCFALLFALPAESSSWRTQFTVFRCCWCTKVNLTWN